MALLHLQSQAVGIRTALLYNVGKGLHLRNHVMFIMEGISIYHRFLGRR